MNVRILLDADGLTGDRKVGTHMLLSGLPARHDCHCEGRPASAKTTVRDLWKRAAPRPATILAIEWGNVGDRASD